MILTHQKGRGTKVHLYLDGEYVATTDENCWFDNYISNETDINDEQWQQLLAKINYKKALNKCADYLSRRDYSAKEIKAKLLKTVDETSAQKTAGYVIDYSKNQEHITDAISAHDQVFTWISTLHDF